MANKLLIILHNASWNDPGLMAIPLFQASVAAAMQYEAEVVLCGHTIELAKLGVAASVHAEGADARSVYDYMRDAVEAGAAIKVCSPPAGLTLDSMIPEIQELVGSAYIVSEAMDPDTVTFTY